jgi:hypothetical protein
LRLGKRSLEQLARLEDVALDESTNVVTSLLERLDDRAMLGEVGGVELIEIGSPPLRLPRKDATGAPSRIRHEPRSRGVQEDVVERVVGPNPFEGDSTPIVGSSW